MVRKSDSKTNNVYLQLYVSTHNGYNYCIGIRYIFMVTKSDVESQLKTHARARQITLFTPCKYLRNMIPISRTV